MAETLQELNKKNKKLRKELEERNRKLRNELESKNDLIKIQRKRTELMRENNRLLLMQKHPNLIQGGKTISKFGVKAGGYLKKGISKWYKVYTENQKKSKMLQKKANRIKSKSSTRKRLTKRKYKR